MEDFLAFFAFIAFIWLIFHLLKLDFDRGHRDGLWHFDGRQMRRWINGTWQFRAPTPEESEVELDAQSRRSL